MQRPYQPLGTADCLEEQGIRNLRRETSLSRAPRLEATAPERADRLHYKAA